MALQIYNTTISSSGIPVALGQTDDVYVGVNGFISSTGTLGAGVYGTGSNHSVTVEGSVVASYLAISVGDDSALDSGQQVTIGENATIASTSYHGVMVFGFASTVENDGIIDAEYGIYLTGSAASGASELVNNGEIDSTEASVKRAGSEDFQFINNGVTDSENNSAYDGSFATGDQAIANNGKMTGTIFFGSGDDTYSGANGMIVSGTVEGYNGNDTLTGGKYAEYFQGDAGRDILKGDGGADHFLFATTTDSTIAKAGRDLIQDFSHAQHDRLDLSGMNEKFSFIGTLGFFGAAGELRYSFKGGSTFVQGDADGDTHADFSIELKGHIALHAGDFIL